MKSIYGCIRGLLLAACCVTLAWAQSSTEEAIAEYRAMFGDENPAELWQIRGEELWTTPRGPKNVALAGCDLGLGAGIVTGAYAQLPRWFEDTQRVQDLESRLVSCLTDLQGLDEAELLKSRFGDGAKKSDLEALTAYIVAASRGHTMSVSIAHPAAQAAYDLGHGVFYYRAGPHDFSCATCHGESGKRIRLQVLPKLLDPVGARYAYTSWPGYRVSQGELRTMEWRLQDCFRQQRLPQLRYGSEVAIGLTMFLAKNAEGGIMTAPNITR
ncbi:MAG: sulfur oxidation c-type cytochrome SoxA [Gammaproteobacteria bacterium]|nr:sulfur oxidation c-type cytochrome SoxA [Gammaproteobacteria bacterium]